MQISIEDVLARYGREISQLTQRAVVAEARADAAEAKLSEQSETVED